MALQRNSDTVESRGLEFLIEIQSFPKIAFASDFPQGTSKNKFNLTNRRLTFIFLFLLYAFRDEGCVYGGSSDLSR
ncbi:hypothetical protein CEXT_576261 [Caerostris extrusa]|uniref:Uncharacterized protein n=1 Tax=Caerostris extrusa TaxID=172846 RepID=A0AAV4QFY0_CAEEX|nr:hypothetical protein CEXT_576261 [Caerostris extrusa]